MTSSPGEKAGVPRTATPCRRGRLRAAGRANVSPGDALDRLDPRERNDRERTRPRRRSDSSLAPTTRSTVARTMTGAPATRSASDIGQIRRAEKRPGPEGTTARMATRTTTRIGARLSSACSRAVRIRRTPRPEARNQAPSPGRFPPVRNSAAPWPQRPAWPTLRDRGPELSAGFLWIIVFKCVEGGGVPAARGRGAAGRAPSPPLRAAGDRAASSASTTRSVLVQHLSLILAALTSRAGRGDRRGLAS